MRLRPSLADLLLVSLIGWLFVAGQGWTVLLADGDTGWHIRTGEWILQSRAIPSHDLFSFSRPSEPWFAWEWLADILFALLHGRWGLAGVTAFTGCTLALGALVVFRYMLWRGANVLVALAATLVAVGASSIHYLARPHVFTLLLMPLAWWIVERDRRRPSRAVWWLIPLSAVWVNLHSGFFALPFTLAVLSVGQALRPRRPHPRYVLLCVATLAASVVNPYGIGLHRHIFGYLTSDWIRNAVDEFQSPSFRGENLLHFELLLVAALLIAGWLVSRSRLADALVVVSWAHLALSGVRHVPVFVTLAAPLVAGELSDLWRAWAGGRQTRTLVRILWQLGTDLEPGFRHLSIWSTVAVAGAILLTPASRWPRDFPEAKFPVSLMRTGIPHWGGSRVFTSDQWGDYLIYHYWPRQRVFIDGRSDFYGPALGGDYLALMEGRPSWESLLEKYDFDLVLIPRQWPLAALLNRHPGWRLVASDRLAALYARGSAPAPRANPVARLDR